MTSFKQESSFKLRTNVDLSDIRKRLRSEHGPAVQSEATSRILADVDKDLQDCGTEIHRLQSRIVFLRNQRRLLEDYKTFLQSLGSPIHRLPNEILLRIFDLACEINELTSTKLQDIPALVISDVCSRWRNLAKFQPCLWSRMCLDLQSATPPHLPTNTLLNLFIESSKQSPLTLEFPSRVTIELEQHHRCLCAVLGAQDFRWKRLAIGNRATYLALTAHNSSSFPLLEQLILPATTVGPHFSLLCTAPSLKCVSLCGIRSEKLRNIGFAWIQLTHLKLAHFDATLRSLPEICPNLKGLSFRQTRAINEYCTPPLVVPVVETLVFLTLSHPDVSTSIENVVLGSLTCPSLISLLVEGPSSNAWPKSEFEDFFTRSSCRLTNLSIKFIPLSDTNFVDLLRLLPSLLHLTIDDSKIRGFNAVDTQTPITSCLFLSLHAFHRPQSNTIPSTLVRKLESLSLTFDGPDTETTFSDRDFVDMVLSRWRPDIYASGYGLDTSSLLQSEGGTVCLRSVVMRFTKRDVDQEIYEPLDHLEKEGMKVVVVGQSSE